MSPLMISSLLILMTLTHHTDSLPVLVQKNSTYTPQDSNETFLSKEDFEAARHLSRPQLQKVSKTDLSLGNMTEGDIAIEDIEQFVLESNQLERNAIRARWMRWPNGVIPYTISTEYDSQERAMLAKAFSDYHQKTCIRFVPRDPSIHQDFISIFPGGGCYSYVGRRFGRQHISLHSGCFIYGTVLHELMHAVGFFHEQSRADRDLYVRIQWSSIRSEYAYNFNKYSLNEIEHLGDYDYGSVMHYGPTAFGKQGQQTIWPYLPFVTIGQRIGFSDGDVKKLNKLYNCRNY